jgi:hypothetical protein
MQLPPGLYTVQKTAIFQIVSSMMRRKRLSPDSGVQKPRQRINVQKRPLPMSFFPLDACPEKLSHKRDFATAFP